MYNADSVKDTSNLYTRRHQDIRTVSVSGQLIKEVRFKMIF